MCKRGRPEVAERTESFTVSLKPSQKKEIEKNYGSLSKALKIILDANKELLAGKCSVCGAEKNNMDV